MNIIRPNVSTLITFKTSEENLICSDMILNYAKIGKVELSSLAMMKVAKDFKSVPLAMAGKNSNFILSCIRPSLAKKRNASKDTNVHFTILKKIKGL